MKVHRMYTPVLMGVAMGVFMSLFMSLVISLINVGLVPEFLFVWMRAWAAGFVISVPVAVMAFPVAKKIVEGITE
jgi:hypothetical protein